MGMKVCEYEKISRKKFARCFWSDFVAVYITMEEWLKEQNLLYVSLFIEMLNQQDGNTILMGWIS